jgi:PIN domain nuclease of toxin-antitoxin system
MRLLLDTHHVLSLTEPKAREASGWLLAIVANPRFDVAVSVVGIWEIAIKSRLGKLPLSLPVPEIFPFLKSSGISLLELSLAHVTHELAPRPQTRDPFDQLLLSQCAVEERRLLTRDRALSDHPLAALVSE